jgi:predicted phosphodiesterase
MKIAVIADIHANLVALQTVLEDVEHWRPDQVVVAGDIVNRGPRPAECWKIVQEKVRKAGWLLVRGNHEDYVLSHDEPGAPRSGPWFEVNRASYWTYSQLNGEVTELRAMPSHQSLVDPDGNELLFYHGSFLGIRDGIYPETDDSALRKKIGLDQRAPKSPPLALFCVGHTHRALTRRLDDVLVVNAGSAGLPFDRDARCAYARLTWSRQHWNAEIVRLKYDRAQAERDFELGGYLEGGGPLARLVLHELQCACSHLYTWALHYQERALQGEISVAESVQRHLAHYAP